MELVATPAVPYFRLSATSNTASNLGNCLEQLLRGLRGTP
jgi:hypothetical protein